MPKETPAVEGVATDTVQSRVELAATAMMGSLVTGNRALRNIGKIVEPDRPGGAAREQNPQVDPP